MISLRILTRNGESVGGVIRDWIVQDILWEIFLAIIIAVAVGWAVGMFINYDLSNRLLIHEQGSYWSMQNLKNYMTNSYWLRSP